MLKKNNNKRAAGILNICKKQNEISMQLKLKDFVVFIVAAVLLGSACQQREEVIDQYLEKNAAEIQEFPINPTEVISITGTSGTRLVIAPNSLQYDDGGALSSEETVSIQLKEVYAKADILYNGLHTISGGQPLVSSGMIHVNASSNGKNVVLKPGKKMEIQFSQSDIPASSQIFNLDTLTGKTDWTVADSLALNTTILIEQHKFYPENQFEGIDYTVGPPQMIFQGDTIPIDSSLISYIKDTIVWDYLKESDTIIVTDVVVREPSTAINKAFSFFQTNRFGWINCDYFMQYEDKTDLIVNHDPNYENISYLIFADLNTVLQADYYNDGVIRGLPMGQKAKLMTIASKDGELYYQLKSFVIGKRKEIHVKLKKVSEEKLDGILEKI